MLGAEGIKHQQEKLEIPCRIVDLVLHSVSDIDLTLSQPSYADIAESSTYLT